MAGLTTNPRIRTGEHLIGEKVRKVRIRLRSKNYAATSGPRQGIAGANHEQERQTPATGAGAKRTPARYQHFARL
jgi:hypothetical protein